MKSNPKSLWKIHLIGEPGIPMHAASYDYEGTIDDALEEANQRESEVKFRVDRIVIDRIGKAARKART